jgi:LPS export ABC transporter protein LptC
MPYIRGGSVKIEITLTLDSVGLCGTCRGSAQSSLIETTASVNQPKMKPVKPYSVVLLSTLMLAIAVGGVSCRGRQPNNAASPSPSAQSNVDNTLTFNNITLEQADDAGKPQWKVKADQVIYSQDKKVGRIVNPDGELYEEGKPVYRIKAESGSLTEDGDQITLTGKVMATDIKSGAILRGDNLVWVPETGLLTIRGNVTGTHPQLNVTAAEARLNNKRRRMDASGGVVAVAKDPTLKLQSDRIAWRMDDRIVLSNAPVRVERLENGRVLDVAVGQKAEVNLATKVATLQQNAGLELGTPPVRVTSSILLWDLKQSTVSSSEPITLVHRQQRVTVTANQGRMDLKKRIVYLRQNVRAIAQRNNSTLVSDRLTWDIPAEQFNAVGNVNYNQPNPPMNVKGPQAVGRLENQVIVVSGGRVVTEIVPEGLN